MLILKMSEIARTLDLGLESPNSHLQRSHYIGTESDSCKLDCVCNGYSDLTCTI